MTHETKDYIAALRAQGYRVTPQRLIVLDAVCSLQTHATFADIQSRVNEMDPTIDRSTVYRALDVLAVVGLIVESELGEVGKVYRIAGEVEHQHLVCLSCGKVQTVEDERIGPLMRHFLDAYGFAAQGDHLVFNGLCAECAAAKSG